MGVTGPSIETAGPAIRLLIASRYKEPEKKIMPSVKNQKERLINPLLKRENVERKTKAKV